MKRLLRSRRVGVLLALIAIVPVIAAANASGAGPTYATGDVFAAVGNGQVKQFSSTGTLLNTLTGNPATYTAGMAFDASGNLYGTGFGCNCVSKFDNQGNFLGSFGSGFNTDDESIVRDAAGDFYVGQADGSRDVLKFDPAGNLLANYDVATEDRGSDWIDLASDQCTLYYTSEGKSVKRFDVCTNTQLSDFATGLPGPYAFALRVLPGGGALVADTDEVVRLDSSGSVVQTYPFPNNYLFALNLDPDGTSFWTGDIITGEVFKVDIASGSILTQFNTGPNTALGGLAVFGEITAALSELTLAPATATNVVGTSHTVTATLKDGSGNPISGATILFSVSGVNSASGSGSSPTDANGQATFSYTGTNVGTDTIKACYDKDNSGTCDSEETTATATKDWTASATGTITVHKTVDAGGESPTSFCFTLSPDPGNGEVCADSSGDAVFDNVPAGTYDATETTSPATYHQVSNDCTGLVLAGGDSLTCDVHDTVSAIAHDVDAHLGIGPDIGLGPKGTNTTAVKADCKNETPAENVHCTLQVSGLPTGCTAKSSAGPLATSPGGFLVDDLSSYAVNQTKHFDFKLTTTCNPNLAKGVVAKLTFKMCADGGVIDSDPCNDTDITPDKSPNVVVKSVKLHR
jgi:hypothetical protein